MGSAPPSTGLWVLCRGPAPARRQRDSPQEAELVVPAGGQPREQHRFGGVSGGELGQGLQPREAPAAPLAPRPAVPLRREEEEEVGMVLGRPHLSCWPQGTWLTLPASQPRRPV